MPLVGTTCYALLLLAGKRIDNFCIENFDTEGCNLYMFLNLVNFKKAEIYK